MLIGYDYTIQHRSGKTNVVADALSRIPEVTSAEFLFLSMPSFSFLKSLKKELLQQPEFNTKLQQIYANPTSSPDFKVAHDLIYYKERIWLPRTTPFIQLLLEEFHKNPHRRSYGRYQNIGTHQPQFYLDRN